MKELIIPVIAIGGYLGYKGALRTGGRPVNGAVIGGLAAAAVYFYFDMKMWEKPLIESEEKTIDAEYEILDNDEDEKNK